MKIVEIIAQGNGAHRSQDCGNTVIDGWAFVPPTLSTPNFPFGTIETAEIDGVMTVTSWTAGVVPEPEPVLPQMTTQEAILDKLTEIEYRQDLMELGLTEGDI